MYLRRDDEKRFALAPAKLNLFLELLHRRDDGFHELETLMVPVRLADTVSFLPLRPSRPGSVAEIRLDLKPGGPGSATGLAESIPTGATNLVVRALELLRQRTGCEIGAEVELVKRIPSAAGLGGGSSNAAAALRLANRAWGINWPLDRLAAVAAEIGSDVPFFLEPHSAICRGRGEKVERLPAIAPIHVVVVKPPVGLSTADVYQAHADSAREAEAARPWHAELAGLVSTLRTGRASAGLWLRNRLQKAASSLTPWVDKLRMEFQRLDVLGHQLSGSGSAYFGVCRHAQHARRIAGILRTRHLGLVFATRSCQ